MPRNDILDSEHHVLLPFFDDDKEIPTEKYNPLTTARQNCITNDQNSFKNTETHNNNNLTPQNIDLVSNPSQVKKEKDVALNPDEWKKVTTLVIGDSMLLAGLREAKLSRKKKFIISQFTNCSLVWMCHGRDLNNKINNLHERALRTVYQDKKSSVETLLKHDKLYQFM